MNFAGKAYIKKAKRNLEPIQEEALEESRALPEPKPRIRRQRSYEALSVGSLNHSFGSDSEEEKDLPDSYEDYIAEAPKIDKEVYDVRVDTNVVSVSLGTLEQASMVATGDPVFCEECRAVISHLSRLVAVNDTTQIWKCEFCGHENQVSMEQEELPTSDSLDYMLMSQSQLAQQRRDEQEAGLISVVFCIDISGSMCVSEPVQGKIQLRTRKQVDLGGFTDFDLNEQVMPHEGNLTYISRLECVQAAIQAQLNHMNITTPDRRVGLVTFNGDVVIIGDGTTDPYTITGDKLNNFEACFEGGSSWGSKMTNTIEGTKDSLIDKLIQLEEGGPTALGPALTTSLGLVSNARAGSKVIICTDGLANIGLGRFDDPSMFEASESFYTKITQIAKDKGIEVSVISIEGEECKLSTLSKVCEATGGEVTRVNPMNITTEFTSILSTPVIATQVQVMVKLHKALTFRHEDVLQDPSTLVKELGNVTSDAEFTFEYSIRPAAELEELQINTEELAQIPFQTQIHYTNPQGIRLMRTITCVQDAVDDLDEAARDINFEVLGVNAAQRSAQLASQGEYREAQTVMRSWKRMMNRNARDDEQRQQLGFYMDNMSMFNRNLNGVVSNEASRNLDRDELIMARNQEQDDLTSHIAFRAKRANKNNKKDCIIM